MPNLHAVILAGGSGTRFWPASRLDRPKQFLPLAHGRPLLAATVDRLAGLCPPEHCWIVTNPRQAQQLSRILPGFPAAQVLVEPEPRDTAPCIALAAAAVASRDPEAILVVLPADHVLEPIDAFHQLVRRGAELAADRSTLVTFGIAPTFAATGYGYIECGQRLDDRSPAALRALRFREKPDRVTAEGFLAAGSFLWNSGIFVWSLHAILAELQAGDPGLAAATAAMQAAMRSGDDEALAVAFRAAPRTSIDYAVMERARQVAVIRAGLRWDDVGSFTSLPAIAPTDAQENTALLASGASQIACESRGNIVYAEGRRTIALFGVHDLVVVAVDDAVLVCSKDRASDLKLLVEELRRQGRTDLL